MDVTYMWTQPTNKKPAMKQLLTKTKCFFPDPKSVFCFKRQKVANFLTLSLFLSLTGGCCSYSTIHCRSHAFSCDAVALSKQRQFSSKGDQFSSFSTLCPV